jgi:hypothetical protein
MKKTKFVVLIITCSLLLVTPVFLLVCGFVIPPKYDNTFLGELKYKYEALEQTEGARIVFVGGSSVAFGVDSKLIAEELPEYSVVNFGMYAALGTKVMLDLSKDSIRPGDIVIISPEQEAQTLSNYFNGEAMWQALDGAFPLLARIESEDLGKLVGQFPYFASRKFNYFIRQDKPSPGGIYNRGVFNEYGDIVSDECQYNLMAGGWDVNTPIVFEEALLDTDFIDYLNVYADELTARGATIWYRFCPMNGAAVQEGADIDDYYDLLQERLHMYIIGDPNNSVMEEEWFYDTNFHLNASGKIVNTNRIIRDIKAMLGDSSATNIILPSKPRIRDLSLTEGDSSDNDCFTYDNHNGELKLTGLTEVGRGREELTIPVSFEGIPLTAVEASVFADNTTIRTITVQENIVSIADNAFEGCSALERVRLKGQNPEKCMVGQHLLDGTKAMLSVDQSVLSDYKLNYFWSLYADRIISE